MNIVFITRKFFPYGDATSGVVGNLAKAMLELGNSVKVIAITEKRLDSYNYTWNDIDVSLVYAPGLESSQYLKSLVKNNAFKALYSLLVKIFARLRMKLNKNYRHLSLDPRYIKAYKKAIKQLDSNVDLYLVTLMPQEAVWTAYNCVSDRTKLAI